MKTDTPQNKHIFLKINSPLLTALYYKDYLNINAFIPFIFNYFNSDSQKLFYF